MTRQRPHVEDIATGTPTNGYVPVSPGPGLPAAWGAVTGGGGGGGGGGNWVLIEDRVLATDGASSSFTSIPDTYRDLRFVIDGKAVGTGAAQGRARMQINGDTGVASYRSTLHYARVGSGNHGVEAFIGGTGNRDYQAIIGYMPGELATDAPDTTGILDLVIYNYAVTGRYKRFYAFSTMTGDQVNGNQTCHASGEWRNNAAVTRVDLFSPLGDGWAAGTRIRFYGWLDVAAGGGDWVGLASHTVPAGSGEATIDFTSISQSYRALVAVGDSLRFVNNTAVGGESIYLRANGWDGSDYLCVRHKVIFNGTSLNHTADNFGFDRLHVGQAGGPDGGGSSFSSFVCWLPGYTVDPAFKNVHSHITYAFGNAPSAYDIDGYIRLTLADHEPIDQLTFLTPSSNPLAPGSRITIYGVR